MMAVRSAAGASAQLWQVPPSTCTGLCTVHGPCPTSAEPPCPLLRRQDVLIATDVASKGLDFAGIQHVINYDMPEEIENYKQNHDPIAVFRRKLIAEGILTEDSAVAINKTAADEAAASVKFADESPAPTIADISTDVYWESDHDTPASKIGRHFFND